MCPLPLRGISHRSFPAGHNTAGASIACCLQGAAKPTKSANAANTATGSASGTWPASALDDATRRLVELVTNEDMFRDAMAAFDIDVDEMPLGQLSQAQVQKGYAALLELQCAPAHASPGCVPDHLDLRVREMRKHEAVAAAQVHGLREERPCAATQRC